MIHRPRLIPCLLLSNGNLVKTTRFKDPNYLGEPVNRVQIFSDMNVDELCVLDIEASKQGREPDFQLLKFIASVAFMPLSYGGGITTVDQAARLFHIGYEKVVLNTSFIAHPELVTEIARRFGSQSVVVSIDAKEGLLHRHHCMTTCGTRSVREEPRVLAMRAQELGAGEILLNSIDRDGMMKGYDLALVRSVADAVNIPLIACGGAGGVDDFKKVLKEGHAHAAAAGSMFVYWGPLKAVLINVPEEQELFQKGIYWRD